MSSCVCGSTKCDCEEECFCFEHVCKCPLCSLLPKMCPHCSLPIYNIADYACQVCTCTKKGSSEAMSSSRTTESDESSGSKVPICCCCKLPIFLVETEDEDELKVSYCRCPQNRIENEPIQSEHETSTSTSDYPQVQSEHETSTSTSDHRQVSADRQVRKALSRKTRSQKSNWQAKKAKDDSFNSPEVSTNINETVGAGTFLTSTSGLHLAGQGSRYSACATSVSNMDINTNFNSPQRLKTDETSMSNLSLLANTSGVSIQCTPEASSFQTSGHIQANIRGREELFPSLPNPIPGPCVSGEQCPSQRVDRNQEISRPILPEQAPVERKEKVEKWFGTIQVVINKSGELPDAETAAELDKLDKEEQLEKGDSGEFPHYDSIPPPSRKIKDDTEHTDTDRSTSVSQSRIESDHIESESDN